MNTSYSNRGTARLALLAIALAAGGVQAQTHRNAGPTSEMPRMRDAGSVSYPYLQGMADTVPDKRLPMVSLSASDGDMGAEMLISGDARHTIASFPKSADKAIVYANIDDLAYDKVTMRAAYKLARDMGWPIYIESNFWDVKALTAHVREYFPEARKINLQSVAVRISWNKGRIVVAKALPADAAVEIGVPFSQTSEGRSIEIVNTMRAQELAAISGFSTKSSETYEQAGSFAMFASLAYNPNATTQTYPFARPGTVATTFKRIKPLYDGADDVMQVWKSTDTSGAYKGYCIVGWRGSVTTGDWINNIKNQFGFSVAVPGFPASSTARIGRGYANRLIHFQTKVNGKGCTNLAFTGHSLGGGMAQAHSATFRSNNPGGIAFWRLAAYNSARPGNAEFKRVTRSFIFPNGVDNTAVLSVRCRSNDPVHLIPTGFVNFGSGNHGCTYMAPAASINPLQVVYNHSMERWLEGK